MSVGLYAIEQMRIFFIQEIIDKYAYTVIEPIGSKPGVLHGLGKNHKETKSAPPPCYSISHYYNYL